MATIIEQRVAVDNAGKNPESAAQFVHDQNTSSYVTDYEAKVAADVLQKFSFSVDDAKRLYKKWTQISDLRYPRLTMSANFPEAKTQKNRADSWGKVIYELATNRYASGLAYASDSDIPPNNRKFLAQTLSVLEREEKEKPVPYDPALANQLSSIAKSAVEQLTTSVGGPSNYKQMFVTADDVLIRKINKTKDKAGSLDRGAIVFYVKKSPEHSGYAEILVGESGKFNAYLISEKYISETQPSVKKLPAAKPKKATTKSIDNPPADPFPTKEPSSGAMNVAIGLAAAALAYFAVKSLKDKA